MAACTKRYLFGSTLLSLVLIQTINQNYNGLYVTLAFNYLSRIVKGIQIFSTFWSKITTSMRLNFINNFISFVVEGTLF